MAIESMCVFGVWRQLDNGAWGAHYPVSLHNEPMMASVHECVCVCVCVCMCLDDHLYVSHFDSGSDLDDGGSGSVGGQGKEK